MKVKATNVMAKAIRSELDLASLNITAVSCKRLTLPGYERYASCAADLEI